MVFEILEYQFIQRAIITGITISTCTSIIGLFLMLRRFSLFGDAFANVAFGGIALGLFLKFYAIWTALIAAVISAIALTKLTKHKKISGDAALGIFCSTGFAIGILFISLTNTGFSVDIYSVLFGNILLTSMSDMIITVIIGLIIISIVLKIKKQLLYAAFDEEQAEISGWNVNTMNYIFMILSSITIVMSMRLTGVLLISALVIIPNVTSILMKQGFRNTMIISVLISVSCTISGIIMSFYFDVAPSATIVLLAVGVLIITLILKSNGIIKK